MTYSLIIDDDGLFDGAEAAELVFEVALTRTDAEREDAEDF